MAITLGTTARDASVNARTALVNGGTIKIKSAGATVLATIALQATAFLASSGGSASLKGGDNSTAASSANPLTDSSADATGTAAMYDICNSSGTVIWSGVVGSDMTIDNTSIVALQEVRVTGLTHGQPA